MSKRVKAHTRYEKRGGERVPGATTVLGVLNKPALVPWANRLGLDGVDVKKYVDEKADIGTLGHQLVTDYIQGLKTDTSEYASDIIGKAENCALSFFEWQKGKEFGKILLCEEPLVSEECGFGGTPDIVAMVDGVPELIDLKTGKGIYPEYRYQVAAYKWLLEENGYDINRVRILNIPRSEGESFLEHVCSERELGIGLEIFMNCLSIYNLMKKEKAG